MIYTKDGKILVNSEGHIYNCDICPCTKQFQSNSGMFAELIEVQSKQFTIQANKVPTDIWQGHVNIPYRNKVFNGWNNWQTANYSTSIPNLVPCTFFFTDYDYFYVDGKKTEWHILPLNAQNEININLYKQTSELNKHRVVSATIHDDHSSKLHQNKFGQNDEYLNIQLHIDINNTSAYQYLSSIAFNQVDYDIGENDTPSTTISQFGPKLSDKTIASNYSGAGLYYITTTPVYGNPNTNKEQYYYKPYNEKIWDRKQYYVSRIMTGYNRAYCYHRGEPTGTQWNIDNLFSNTTVCGGKDCNYQAGDTIYLGKPNDGYENGVVFLHKVEDKYYYYNRTTRLINEYPQDNDHEVSSFILSAKTFTEPVSKYYTGLRFKIGNTFQYLYTRPEKVEISGYSTSNEDFGVLSENLLQRDIINEPTYGIVFDSDGPLPLKYDSSIGWYYIESVDENLVSNRNIPLNIMNENGVNVRDEIDVPENEQAYYSGWTGTVVHLDSYYYNIYYGDWGDYPYMKEGPVVNTGYYIFSGESFYPLVWQDNIWKFKYSENSWKQLTDRTNENNPYSYWYDYLGKEIYFINYGTYYKIDNDQLTCIIPHDILYDSIYGHTIDTQIWHDTEHAEGHLVDYRILPHQYEHRNLSPFLRFKTVTYKFKDYKPADSDNVNDSLLTISDYLTGAGRLSDKSTPTVGTTWNTDGCNISLREWNGESYADGNYIYKMGITYGQRLYSFDLITFKISLPTNDERTYTYNNELNSMEKEQNLHLLSSLESNLRGVYCQIITGLHIQPVGQGSEDDCAKPNEKYQYRQQGSFFQVLEFDKQYAFGIHFLMNKDSNNNLIDPITTLNTHNTWTSYLTTLTTSQGNPNSYRNYSSFGNLFQRTSNMSALVNTDSTEGSLGSNLFKIAYLVLPISGVTSISNNNSDGHLNNLAPATLTGLTL